jgi:hypothetical protein
MQLAPIWRYEENERDNSEQYALDEGSQGVSASSDMSTNYAQPEAQGYQAKKSPYNPAHNVDHAPSQMIFIGKLRRPCCF